MSSRLSMESEPDIAVNEAEKGLLHPFRIPSRSKSKLQAPPLFWSICCIVAFIATGLAGFFLGRLNTGTKFPKSAGLEVQTWPQGAVFEPSEANGMPFNLQTKTNMFIANRTFLQRPSEENDALWRTLYPKNHGLFEWPDHAPERAGFASFHQLHCVDALRKSWYTDLDIKTGLRNGQDVSHIEEFEADHVLHCVEFLRQSIMCHADTSIQKEVSYHRGIMAFGMEYQCRDWVQLVNWVDDRNTRMFGSAESW